MIKIILHKLRHVSANITNRCYFYYKGLAAKFNRQTNLKILFSEGADFEHFLKLGFMFTEHDIVFKKFPLANINEYDLLVPLSIDDLIYLSKMQNKITGNAIPIPSTEAILLCNDKYLLNEKLICNGFNEFIPTMGHPDKYPQIIKKRVSSNGFNSHIINDNESAAQYANLLTNPDYFVQEFISGENEYTTHILFKNKTIKHTITNKFYFNTDIYIKGRDAPQFYRICRCPYLNLFAQMLNIIEFDGLCSINYKVRNNKLLIFEVNPRLGATASLMLFSFIHHV